MDRLLPDGGMVAASMGPPHSGLPSPRPRDPTPDPVLLQSTMQELNLSENSSDEYRSVIDDLTVENRDLRQRLMKYERLHCAHLEGEKLFEVKFYGLDPEKKRELEEALRAFASTLDSSSPNNSSSSAEAAKQPPSSSDLPSSTSGPRLRPADSGYGSISISGHTADGRSCEAAHQSGSVQTTKALPSLLRQASDCQTRPEWHSSKAAPPVRVPVMTENMKRRLVVKRLEQLFTGKRAQRQQNGGLALQQPAIPNVSLSQAESAEPRADHKHRPGGTEGIREARILPPGKYSLNDTVGTVTDGHPPLDLRTYGDSDNPTPPSEADSPEQRPTRPLDLDLHRAQYAAENLDYIRHLGMSTPSLDHATDAEPSEGWVYLNLLSNMAQLHTLNVTPTFIREAVSTLSKRLEISGDGRKIRWKGGLPNNQPSSPSTSDAELSDPSSAEFDDNPPTRASRKRKFSYIVPDDTAAPADGRGASAKIHLPCRSSNIATDRRGVDPPTTAQPGSLREGSRDRFAYQPLFFRQESSDSYFADSSSSSPGPTGARPVSSKPSDPPEKRARETGSDGSGPVIFYKGAKFCTDLSGDATTIQSGPGLVAPSYQAVTKAAVGCVSSPALSPSPTCKSPLRESSWEALRGTATPPMAEIGMAPSPISFESDAGRGSVSPASTDASSRFPAFEVSGLAGVLPADHFRITVRTRYSAVAHDKLNKLRPNRTDHRPSASCVRRLRRHHLRRDDLASEPDEPHMGITHPPSVRAEVAESSWVELPPSALPPPSCLGISLLSSSNGDEDGDDCEDADGSSCSSSSSSGRRNGNDYGYSSDSSFDQPQALEPPASLLMNGAATTSGPSRPAMSSSSSPLNLLAFAGQRSAFFGSPHEIRGGGQEAEGEEEEGPDRVGHDDAAIHLSDEVSGETGGSPSADAAPASAAADECRAELTAADEIYQQNTLAALPASGTAMARGRKRLREAATAVDAAAAAAAAMAGGAAILGVDSEVERNDDERGARVKPCRRILSR